MFIVQKMNVSSLRYWSNICFLHYHEQSALTTAKAGTGFRGFRPVKAPERFRRVGGFMELSLRALPIALCGLGGD
ncbi:MAG: hypothetical protein CVU57_00355 [Deltaproteobacteria bacterium HGW-Deltaproteobacteria-15]|nr:MAG: hypothetical protein CVU57_00355 [Deltaproteobacteria bacterium HGW-Deltaproteobacteria-15]